jgi:hypothetical protein
MSIRGRVARQLMTTPWVHPNTGGFYYRKVIPPRARHLFGGKVEVRRSPRCRRAEALSMLHHSYSIRDRDPCHALASGAAGAGQSARAQSDAGLASLVPVR